MRKLLLMCVGAALAGGTAEAAVTIQVDRGLWSQPGLAGEAYVETFDRVDGTPYLARFGGAPLAALFNGFSFADGAAALNGGNAIVKLKRGARAFGYRADAVTADTTVELLSRGESLGVFGFDNRIADAGNVAGALAWGIEQMMGTGSDYVTITSDLAFDEVRFVQWDGALVMDDVAVGQLVPVPEPATWAMMILGFGAAGTAIRRRHRVTGVRFA